MIKQINKHYKKEIVKTLNLAFPILIAQLGVVLMGVCDNIMVGRYLGKISLGAAGISNSVSYLIASLAIGGISVIAPRVSKAKAEKDLGQLKRIFYSTFFVSFGYSLVLSILGLVCVYNFELLNQSSIINKEAIPFFSVILISNIPMYFFVGAKQLSDGLSLPKISMNITIIGVCINLALNYVLINGLLGFPKLGLVGSALSTLIARATMLLILLSYIFTNTRFKEILSQRISKIFNSQLIVTIYKLSIPGGLQFFFEIGAFSFAVIMMGWINEDSLAAHQIAINIAATTYMMASGIGFAGGIRVGDAWGLKSLRQIKTAGYSAIILVFLFMTISMIFILLFDATLVDLYISDPEVKRIALQLLVIAAIFQLSDGIQVVGLGILRGLADVKIPTIITFVSYWLIALPGGYLMCFVFKMGAIGIWLGLLLGLSFAGLFLLIRFTNLIKPEIIKKRIKKG
jgi:multidrug resistance protein, MATE family